MKQQPGNISKLEGQKNRVEKDAAEELAEAKKLKEQIEKITVEMKAKSGEGGRLFGSITTKQIADALNKTMKALKWIDVKWIYRMRFGHLDLRMFRSKFILDVTATLKVHVTEEN